jgi:hypothetical protein
MTSQRNEFPPLFGKGIHSLSLAELKKQIVDPFADSRSRSPLHSSLDLFLSSLSGTGLIFEAWVYGPILTSEQNPDRVGLIIPYDPQSYDELCERGLMVVDNLFNPHVAFWRFGIAVQPVDRSVEEGIRYTLSKLATEQDGITPSGIVSVRFKP